MRYLLLLILFSGIVIIGSQPLTAQIVVNNVVDKDGAVNDGKPMDPSPEVKVDIVGFGCVTGFKGWVEPAKPADVEKACDEENIKQFKAVYRKCVTDRHAEKVNMFDLDRDDCATCDDYYAWKNDLKRLYDLEKRSTDGQSLVFEPCDGSSGKHE